MELAVDSNGVCTTLPAAAPAQSFPPLAGCPVDVKHFVPFSVLPIFNQGAISGPPRHTLDENEILYIEQLQRYPQLPLDAHRKILQMGNEIIHYFEARLIHVENPNNVESYDSFIVFLKSPTTSQHWVMAFVKQQNRIVVKFNRLLTVHLRVSMQNPLTIDIEPSKSPNRRNDEQFIFNFENQRICAEFLCVLNICKKEVWTRRGLPYPRQSRSTIPRCRTGNKAPDIAAVFPPPILRKSHSANSDGDTGSSGNETEEVPQKQYSTSPPRGSISNNKYPGIARGDPMLKELENPSAPPKFLRFPYRMKFILRHSAVLCVRKDKKSTEYGVLGVGTLKIWGNDDCFDQLDFIARHTNDLICSHPIYSWNTVTLTAEEEHRMYNCKWTAAADILAAPNSLPAVREFRVVFSALEMANSFKAAFEESCTKAARPEIIFKSNQINPTPCPELGFLSLTLPPSV